MINLAIKSFLEPEGRETDEVYVQGLSTSLPEDIQLKMIAIYSGLRKCSNDASWLCN